jgi:hypothetical protein
LVAPPLNSALISFTSSTFINISANTLWSYLHISKYVYTGSKLPISLAKTSKEKFTLLLFICKKKNLTFNKTHLLRDRRR